MPPDFVVNVDADISFEPDYFERLLDRFDADPSLGIASGSAFELEDGDWRAAPRDRLDGLGRVARVPLGVPPGDPAASRSGSRWDGIDEFKANARGWRTQAFEDIPFRHHRREGERDGAVAARAATRATPRTTSAIARGTSFSARSCNARREPAALGMIGATPRPSCAASRAAATRTRAPTFVASRACGACGCARSRRPDAATAQA